MVWNVFWEKDTGFIVVYFLTWFLLMLSKCDWPIGNNFYWLVKISVTHLYPLSVSNNPLYRKAKPTNDPKFSLITVILNPNHIPLCASLSLFSFRFFFISLYKTFLDLILEIAALAMAHNSSATACNQQAKWWWCHTAAMRTLSASRKVSHLDYYFLELLISDYQFKGNEKAS